MWAKVRETQSAERTPGDMPGLELLPSVPVFSAPVFFLFLTDHPCFLYRWGCLLRCSRRYLSWEYVPTGEPESVQPVSESSDNMWLQRRIREQFCTQSRGKLVELNEMGHFQSERGFYSAASFLLNFHFPSHYRDSFKESLCCWATNVFLANHKIFTSCFNFLP